LCATYLAFGGDTCRVEVAEELEEDEEKEDSAALSSGEEEEEESSSRGDDRLSSSESVAAKRFTPAKKGEKKKSLKFSRGGAVKLTNTKEAQKITSARSIPLGDHFEHFAAHCDVGDEIFIAPLIGNNNDKSAKLIVRNVERETVTCECDGDLEFDVGFAGNSIAIRFRRESGALSPGDEQLLKKISRSVPVDFVSFGGATGSHQLADLKRAAQKFYPKVALIARVDTLKALQSVKETCKVADAILLARGDLGAVIAPEKMFRVQKFVLRVCEELGTVAVVTRLVDSMIKAPRPTRAEATDIANIVLDGADALMLGKETYSGMFPVECVKTVLAIANAADRVYDYESRYARQKKFVSSRISALSEGRSDKFPSGKGNARESKEESAWMKHISNVSRKELHKWSLADAAVSCAYQTRASCIVVFSHTGETTRMIAKYRPICPVMSLTIPSIRGGSLSWVIEGAEEARQQLIIRGIIPVLSDGREAVSNIISNDSDVSDVFLDAMRRNPSGAADVEAMARLRQLGLIKPGGVCVFCQLIGGVSTVKILEYGGRVVDSINVGTSSPGSPEKRRAAALHAQTSAWAAGRRDSLHDDNPLGGQPPQLMDELFGNRAASPSLQAQSSIRMANVGTFSGENLSDMQTTANNHVAYPPPMYDKSKLGNASQQSLTSSIGNLTISHSSRESLGDMKEGPPRQMSPLGRISGDAKRSSFDREKFARRRIELEREKEEIEGGEAPAAEADDGTPFGKNISSGMPPSAKYTTSPSYTGRM
jgi:pyruvate kinase